jgi:exodeoxyribonuclease-3
LHGGRLSGTASRVKVATWNVNSIRARVDAVSAWLQSARPDILCLQETKVVDDDFPREVFLRAGYSLSIAGQRTYNGVAIASRESQSDVQVGFDNSDDPEQRLILAKVSGVTVVSAYVPNGKMVDSESFGYKLDWLAKLRDLLQAHQGPLLVCGDFNIARGELDVFDVERMRGQLHFHPKEHLAFDALLGAGVFDLYREKHPLRRGYTWWDYRAGAFKKDRGLRIDYLLGSLAMRDRLLDVDVDRTPRAEPKPSDHTPVWATFSTP